MIICVKQGSLSEQGLLICLLIIQKETNTRDKIIQCSHTSQMRKFKGISRLIKGSKTHFQGYFWKTVVTLLYLNKISSNVSHLLQEFSGYIEQS